MGWRRRLVVSVLCGVPAMAGAPVLAQLIDRTLAPNRSGDGIALSLEEQVGPGRGDWFTPDSSSYIINRDPFRAVRRGRQLFQRKFQTIRGFGPLTGDGIGDVETIRAIGAGLADSCASCHGRPRGAAGFGGDVATRPDSRDAPHLFGLGLKEMLADEITRELRAIRDQAIATAVGQGRATRRPLVSKGVFFGQIVGLPNGIADTSLVEGVDSDLRVRPFFAHGETMSIREFIVGALNAEMGLQVSDPELLAAHQGARIVTPSGMLLDGGTDAVEAPPAGAGEIDPAVVDYLEFYLLNYFKPARGQETADTESGQKTMQKVGCTGCHVPDLTVTRDRRVADVDTVFDPVRGHFNRLFATARGLFTAVQDVPGHPALKLPSQGSFVVRNVYTDFKRHDLGPGFHEREYDTSIRRAFLTTPLWGVGSTAPYGHDGRSITLLEVILRHGGEAQASRDAFAALAPSKQQEVIAFLNSLIVFPPDDTASNLDPGDPLTPGFPQFGHGSVRLTVLFNNPLKVE
ncbi:MAG TPA: di-heme oxidoredictase family protein [Vicinamibacterales bacterium]|nr:di-heme oxidoredictase family protein [Vicinamibacterales bacterium]